MKILLTGGAGFIGSHIVEAYRKAGHDVVVLDALLNKNPNLPHTSVPLIREDINLCNLVGVLNQHRIQVINHHAAQVNVRTSLADPVSDATQNILATIRLLQAAVMAENPVKLFIFSSSGGAIYGAQSIYPTPENAPLKPESPYGLAKLTAENYIQFFQKTYRLKTAILRYANVYGPRQDPGGEAGVISIFIDHFLRSQAPTIYGDGAQTRDFVFVKDVAQANVAVLEKNVDGIFNIGTGVETSINQLTEGLQSIFKSNIEISHSNQIPGELQRSAVDISRTRKNLDWLPLTSLEAGLSETIAYIKQQKNT